MSEGTTATTLSPFNPEDAMSVQSFFTNIANTIVKATELAKTVAELQETVNGLRQEVDDYRRSNRWLDQQIVDLRSARDQALNDSTGLRIDLETVQNTLQSTITSLETTRTDRDYFQQKLSTTCEARDDARHDRDDAQMKCLELEDSLKASNEALSGWTIRANAAEARLASLSAILNPPTPEPEPIKSLITDPPGLSYQPEPHLPDPMPPNW